MGYLVRWRDPSLALIGVLPFDSLTFVTRMNDAGTWSLEMDATSEAASWVAPGGGVVISTDHDPATVLLSGPVRTITTSAEEQEPGAKLALAGIDDTGRLAQRLCRPTPGAAITAQGTAYPSTGILEAALRDLVNVNAGPGARVERRMAGLVLGAYHALGPSVDSAVRYLPLLDYLALLCAPETVPGYPTVSGGYGFRVVQVGSTLEFQVYQSVDRSATAKFSRGLGNLRAYTYSVTAPTITAATMGGSGDLNARVLSEFRDDAAESDWHDRLEGWLDARDKTSSTELYVEGREAIKQYGPRASLSLSPIDTPDMTYGVHYGLGDLVTVIGDWGGQVVDVVREVSVTCDAQQTSTVTPLIGTPNAAPEDADRNYMQVRQLARRLRKVERN